MLHVTDAKYIRDKIVWISFDDGTSGEVNLRDHLLGPVFEPLKEDSEFSKVAFDEELDTIVWPNGADFAPEFLRGLLESEPPVKRSA